MELDDDEEGVSALWIDKTSSFREDSCAVDSTLTRGDFDGGEFEEDDEELSWRFLSLSLDICSYVLLNVEILSF